MPSKREIRKAPSGDKAIDCFLTVMNETKAEINSGKNISWPCMLSNGSQPLIRLAHRALCRPTTLHGNILFRKHCYRHCCRARLDCNTKSPNGVHTFLISTGDKGRMFKPWLILQNNQHASLIIKIQIYFNFTF